MNIELLAIFNNEKKTIIYLIENNVFRRILKCPSCRCMMYLDEKNFIYRCSKRACRRRILIFKNTFFDKHKIPINKILQIVHFCLLKIPVESIIALTGCSSSTICNWLLKLKIFLASDLEVKELLLKSMKPN